MTLKERIKKIYQVFCNTKKRENSITPTSTDSPARRGKRGKMKKVGQYTLSGELVRVWECMREADRNGFHIGAVSACCNNKYHCKDKNVYHGYVWKFMEE